MLWSSRFYTIRTTFFLPLLLFFLSCLFYYEIALSQIHTSKEVDAEWRLTHIKLSIGVEYLSNLSQRGATFYDAPQIFPIFALEIFSPQLQLLGSSLFYRTRLRPNLVYRSQLNTIKDRVVYKTRVPLTDRNKREKTMEFSQIIDWEIPNHGEIRFSAAQDIKAHGGIYLSTQLRLVPMSLKIYSKTIEPALFITIGAGSKAHNQYLYGRGAEEFSFTDYSIGFSLSLPPTIDPFFPFLKIQHYGVLGTKNKNASLVRGEPRGWQFLLLGAVKVF